MREVRIVAKDPAIDITVPMGAGPAQITAGLGGWEPVERVDDISIVDWVGQGPLVQDVPLMLDGFAEGESVERELNTILKLGRDPNGPEVVPPVFRVHGPIHYSGKAWVLPDGGIELLEGAIRRRDGELVRQPLVLHLLEYVRPDPLKVRRKRKRSEAPNGGTTAPGKRYRTTQGQSLVDVAADVYGDWKRAKEIGQKNGIRDVNRVLPEGTELKL